MIRTTTGRRRARVAVRTVAGHPRPMETVAEPGHALPTRCLLGLGPADEVARPAPLLPAERAGFVVRIAPTEFFPVQVRGRMPYHAMGK